MFASENWKLSSRGAGAAPSCLTTKPAGRIYTQPPATSGTSVGGLGETAIRAWAAQWAPWCGPDEIADVIRRIAANPQKWKADPLAHRLGFYMTNKLRTASRLTTIGDIDVGKAGREQRRAANSSTRSETRRREGGARPRSEWLLENNADQTEPWAAMGISRRTYYRRKANGLLLCSDQCQSGGTGANAAKRGEAMVCSEKCHDRSPDGISLPPVSTAEPACDRGPPEAASRQPPRPLVIRLTEAPTGKFIDQHGVEIEIIPQPHETRDWQTIAMAGMNRRPHQ